MCLRPKDGAVFAWLLGPTGGRFLTVEPPRRNGVLMHSDREVEEKDLARHRLIWAPLRELDWKKSQIAPQGAGCWVCGLKGLACIPCSIKKANARCALGREDLIPLSQHSEIKL